MKVNRMTGATWRSLAVLGVLVVIRGSLAAQEASISPEALRAQALSDLETMESKFVELAEAMDSDMYAWRPMEGVRSVGEVFILIAAENYSLPSAWGVESPEGAVTFQTMNEVTEKSAVLEHLRAAFAHCKAAVEAISDPDMVKTIRFFGRERPVHAAVAVMTNDMHEHLGQAIAYARMNEVVPPWTARRQEGNE